MDDFCGSLPTQMTLQSDMGMLEVGLSDPYGVPSNMRYSVIQGLLYSSIANGDGVFASEGDGDGIG